MRKHTRRRKSRANKTKIKHRYPYHKTKKRKAGHKKHHHHHHKGFHLFGGKTRKKQKGGFGNGACPFIGEPWDPVQGGKFFKLGTPIGVGGTPPFPGMTAPSPQNPWINNQGIVGGSAARPLMPQPLLNAYRQGIGGLNNLYRQNFDFLLELI